MGLDVVRPINWADLPDCVRLERAAQQFERPWDVGAFSWALQAPRVAGLLRETVEGRLRAFVWCELHARRVHLLNLAVAPSEQRQGLGRSLIEALIATQQREASGRGQLIADASEHNLPAQLFLRACGFRAYQTLRAAEGDAPDYYVFRKLFEGAAG